MPIRFKLPYWHTQLLFSIYNLYAALVKLTGNFSKIQKVSQTISNFLKSVKKHFSHQNNYFLTDKNMAIALNFFVKCEGTQEIFQKSSGFQLKTNSHTSQM
jgi:hypothetical protein